jgi:flagellar motor protein MotB
MNRFYLVAPLLLLAIFWTVFWQNNKAAETKAAQIAAGRAIVEKAERQQKEEAERKAREDAGKRAAAREAEEQKKEEERRLKWEADLARIAAETAQYQAQLDAASRELAGLETQLAALRSDLERRNRETFDAARATELLAIKKRNTELEIQRLVQIVATRAATIATAANLNQPPSIP